MGAILRRAKGGKARAQPTDATNLLPADVLNAVAIAHPTTDVILSESEGPAFCVGLQPTEEKQQIS